MYSQYLGKSCFIELYRVSDRETLSVRASIRAHSSRSLRLEVFQELGFAVGKSSALHPPTDIMTTIEPLRGVATQATIPFLVSCET